MNARVEPVLFVNRNNVRLFGILHRPENARTDVGVIILSPGIKSRIAPHRLYVKMAMRFCQMGFCVFRFDPHGIGDSQGEIEELMAADFYGSVQVGRFVSDTIDAMDWMERENRISRFIIAGLCGGAITGLLTGAVDKRVHSLLGLGIPVILDNAVTDQSKYMTRGQLEDLRESYINKLTDLKSWSRLLSMKSDYGLIMKSLLTFAKNTKIISNTKNSNTCKLRKSSGQAKTNFNPYFPMALQKMLSSRKVFFIFSEADRLYWEFEEKYAKPYKNDYEKYKDNLSIFIVKDANHIFSFKEWQELMMENAEEWIMHNS